MVERRLVRNVKYVVVLVAEDGTVGLFVRAGRNPRRVGGHDERPANDDE